MNKKMNELENKVKRQSDVIDILIDRLDGLNDLARENKERLDRFSGIMYDEEAKFNERINGLEAQIKELKDKVDKMDRHLNNVVASILQLDDKLKDYNDYQHGQILIADESIRVLENKIRDLERRMEMNY